MRNFCTRLARSSEKLLPLKIIVTVENGVVNGGFGSAVLEFMADNGYTPQIRRIGIPDCFIEHGTIPELYHQCGMDSEGISEQIKDILTQKLE